MQIITLNSIFRRIEERRYTRASMEKKWEKVRRQKEERWFQLRSEVEEGMGCDSKSFVRWRNYLVGTILFACQSMACLLIFTWLVFWLSSWSWLSSWNKWKRDFYHSIQISEDMNFLPNVTVVVYFNLSIK